MDSPPECVLSLSCDQLQSSPTLPSLDHSPQASSPHTRLSLPGSPVALPIHSPEPFPNSPDSTPYFALSPFPLHHGNSNNQPEDEDDDDEDDDDDEEDDGLDGVPLSPTPAVALFPGGGGQDAGCLDSSPPTPPSAPLLGFGALELALSSGQSGNCNDELDLQLFQKDTFTRAVPGVGGTSSGPALRFPCHVCGKRFRFQSILSLHARAHTLDRDRRASALYRTAPASTTLKQPLKVQQNHKDIIQNHRSHLNPCLLTGPLIKHLTEGVADDEVKALDGVKTAQNPHFLLDESTPLTPPLTEDQMPITSPLFSSPSTIVEAASTPIASTFRCHACKGKFRTASELARHVRILHNPYKCILCPFSASQEESLASHLQECHPSPEVPTLTPVLSSRPVIATPDTPVPTPTHTPAPTPSTPQSAATITTSTPLPAFRCDTCGQRFTQSWFLKGHMRKHKDSLDHKCQVCGRGFKEPWFLKNHMKVHLNKLGLKAGLGSLGGPVCSEQLAKGSSGSQSLNTLYSSLFLAQRGGGGGGGRGRQGRAERGMTASKSAILGYLGLPSDGGGSSCMERLQAVAQVAEMGNGSGSIGSHSGADSVRGTTRPSTGENTALVSDGADQTTWWQLVARSLTVAQQQQQHRPQQQSQHGQRGTSRNSVITETDQVRSYLGGLATREGATVAGSASGPWECPDCGKLFRSLQQVVIHARVHSQRPHKAGSTEDEGSGCHRGADAGRSSTGEVRQESQLHGGGSHQAGDVRQESKIHNSGTHQGEGEVTGFHSGMSGFKGHNGLTAVSPVPSVSTRERVRGRGIKDCPYCGKAFRSSHHLKVHLRVHTGERPYKCPHCDYAGTQSGSLKYHLQRHHREQRNALSASSNASSTSITTTSGLAKHRRAQLNHCLGTRGPADTPNSTATQQPWLMGLPDQREHRKALAALRDVDLETQYRYLSGVMGALYQGGMEGAWIRESPPPKAPKVSRRKPLTTSRMVQQSSESKKEGSASLNQEGGFEPLDLSRRPSPGFGGMEEDGVTSGGEAAGGEGGDGRGEGATGVKLSQCLFCPFRTSSGELMAMHLQVNHTSKSRRKRGSSTISEDGESIKITQPRTNHSNFDSMALWKHISEAKSHTSQEEWSFAQAQIHNGFSVDAVEQLGGIPDQSHSNLTNSPVLKGNMMIDDEDQEQEAEENLMAAEDNSSLGDSPGLEQDLRMSLALLPDLNSNHMVPDLNSNHMVTEDEPVLTN